MKYGVNTVHIPKGIKPEPSGEELFIAALLSEYFQKEVTFVERGATKTADIEICGRYWEIKSPTGNGKHTIQNNLRKADNQSENIILDLRASKLHGDKAIGRIKTELARANRIKRLIVVTKSEKIIVIL